MIDGSEKRKRELAFELQSSRVFEKRSKSSDVLSKSTGNEPFPLQICLDAIKFVLPSVFTLNETTCPRICSKLRPKSATSPLPVGVHWSKTSLGNRFNSVRSCTKKSCMYIFALFLLYLQDHGLLRSRLYYHDNVR